MKQEIGIRYERQSPQDTVFIAEIMKKNPSWRETILVLCRFQDSSKHLLYTARQNQRNVDIFESEEEALDAALRREKEVEQYNTMRETRWRRNTSINTQVPFLLSSFFLEIPQTNRFKKVTQAALWEVSHRDNNKVLSQEISKLNLL